MGSREQFEKWFPDMVNGMPQGMVDVFDKMLFMAWEASRASIEIKIDNHDEFEIEHMTSCPEGYAKGWIDGRNYAARKVKEAGITVKGE